MPAETTLQLLVRPNCHLCEEAHNLLKRMGAAFATIDIEADPELERLYGELIPVLLLNDVELLRAPINESALRAALQRVGILSGRG